jgi:hypothetical protein
VRKRGLGAALAVAALAGCAHDVPAGSPTVLQTVQSRSDAAADAAKRPATRATQTPEPAPTGTLNYDSGLPVDSPEPVWDEASRTAAEQAAVVAMTAFARPDVPYEQWWTAVAPCLSVQAQVAYQYVDPINVPAHSVAGLAAAADAASASVAQVQVITDVGTYTVVLSREDAQAAWLVERFTPPEGVG